MTNRQMMWCIAAALAAGGILEPSAVAKNSAKKGLEFAGCEELEVPVQFSAEANVTHEGYLRTTSNYAVRIDQVTMNPCKLAVSKEPDATISSSMEVMSVEGLEQSMRIEGVSLKGRVFDLSESGSRLPGEGVFIEGQLPVEVLMKKARRVSVTQPWKSEEVMWVEYELPTHFFDDVDWSKLKG